MNVQNKPSQIKKLAENLRVAEWQVHKAIFELNSGDDKVLTNYFKTNSLEARLKEVVVRVEEAHIYLMKSRTISTAEFNPINLRIGHLKTDCKHLLDEYSDISPNVFGKLKNFIKEETEKLLQRNMSQDDFVMNLEFMLNDVLRITKEDKN